MPRADVEAAVRAASFYRKLGLRPLPSREDAKGPALASYAEFWRRDVPWDLYLANATANVQLVCGVGAGLVVVDLDGDAGVEAFGRLEARHGGAPETWTVRTGSGGIHRYFAPPDGSEEVPRGRVWGRWDTAGGRHGDGDWTRHEAVEVLGDQSLAIAPPSIHVETGRRYAFVPGLSPREIARPAPLPRWIAELPRLGRPDFGGGPRRKAEPPPPPAADAPRRATGNRYGREAVIAAIGGRMLEAGAMAGLRFHRTTPNASGWVPTYAVSRGAGPGRSAEDTRPSASFHLDTGVYMEHYDREAISLFDVAALTRRFPTWQAARDAFGDHFGAKPASVPFRPARPEETTRCAS